MSNAAHEKVKSLTPKQEERRQRILRAARDMVADHGFPDHALQPLQHERPAGDGVAA